MRKLSAMDAMFLYAETATTPMHVGSLQYLQVEPSRRNRFYEDFKAMLSDRIHLVPYLTSRVEFIPGNIDHPVWVRHADFRIEEHLQRIQLPQGSDHRTVEKLAAELYEPLMDRSKPLWQMWVFEGLADGQLVLMQKTHHAAIDGMSSLKVAELLFDFTPVPRAVDAAPADFWNEPAPSSFELVAHALQGLASDAFEGYQRARLLGESISLAASQWVRGARRSMDVQAPKTALNGSIDHKRSFTQVSMSLADIKAIAKAAGVKVNDVTLAICGEAVRSYLQTRGEQPRQALVANCPVSLHLPGDESIGNKVGAMNVCMFDNEPDLGVRLRAIHDAANNAKAVIGDFREVLSQDVRAFGLPMAAQQSAQLGESGLAADLSQQVPMNLVLSNVPGFQVPLYVAGARLLSQMPMSIVAHGSALNLTVTSYLDQFDLGITAATRRLPDIERLRDCVETAYARFVGEFLEAGAQQPEPAMAVAA